MPRHLGICVRCATTKECIETTHGSMCPPCFKAALDEPTTKHKIRLFSFPDAGQKVFVVKEGENTYITMNGVLYAYYRREDAEEIADAMRKHYAAPTARVEEEDARLPLLYVLRQDLKLIGVAEARLTDGPLKDDEIPKPKL